MRIIVLFACAMMAFQCVGYATGMEVSRIVNPDFLWLWWMPAVGWMSAGIRVILNGVE